MKIYLRFILFRDTEKVQAVEIFPRDRQGYMYTT